MTVLRLTRSLSKIRLYAGKSEYPTLLVVNGLQQLQCDGCRQSAGKAGKEVHDEVSLETSYVCLR